MFNLKSVLLVVCMFVGLLSILIFLPHQKEELNASDYLRIHIRANSNSSVDQEVKYKVKDEIVKTLTPILSDARTKEEAINLVNQNMEIITNVADGVLRANNFSYSSKAEIREEYFPTRSYEGFTLQSDVYDALILELGSGKGDNWWCVVYPPMCFVPTDVGGKNVEYRSKILEIIKNFFK